MGRVASQKRIIWIADKLGQVMAVAWSLMQAEIRCLSSLYMRGTINDKIWSQDSLCICSVVQMQKKLITEQYILKRRKGPEATQRILKISLAIDDTAPPI